MMGAKPARLPIFPLAGAILFPRAQLPLHIFEERYRAMIEDALAGSGRIAMIQPLEEEGERPGLYRVGCVGELVGVEELDDGRYNVMLLGSSRFRLIAEAEEHFRATEALAVIDDAQNLVQRHGLRAGFIRGFSKRAVAAKVAAQIGQRHKNFR